MTIKNIIFFLLFIYILLCLIMFMVQRKLQYLPINKLNSLEYYQLNDFTEHKLTTKDNVTLISWFKKPQNNNKIILFLHGNAGNLANRVEKFKIFSQNSDYGILALSYRGFGRSTGKPSELGLLIDAYSN